MSPRLFPLALAALVVVAPLEEARAQDAVQKMIELNRQALTAFGAKDYEGAKSALMDAVVLGKEAGLTNDKMMARTYLHLGVVYVDGLKDRAKGLRYLGLALRIRPDIPMTPSLVTPTVTAAFEEAKRDPQAASAGAAAPAPKAAPKPAPPPPPAPKPAPPPPPAPVAKAPPPPPPEPEPASEPAPEPKDDEPDLPANLPTPLYCPNPDEAPPGEAITLRCVANPTLVVAKVLLYYRLPGGENFAQVPAQKSPKGWYIGTIPSDAATGKSLQYYFEARDSGAKEVASNGHNDSPNLMLIKEGAPVVGKSGALAGLRFSSKDGSSGTEENPLEEQEHERQLAAQGLGKNRRRAKAIFVGVTVGTGYGFHPETRLEYRNDLKIGAGMSSVGLMHIAPEIGYMITESLSIALQGRFQYIPEQGRAQPNSGAPAHGANSVLAKLTYGFGLGNVQFTASLAAGGGEGYRLQVPPKPTNDAKTSLPRNDTVRAGPFIVAPGFGVMFHFHPAFAWVVDTRALIGRPDPGYAVEINTGPQVAF